MKLSSSTPKRLEAWLGGRIIAIWTNLLTNHLWQRMLKNTLATTIAVILAIIPAVVRVYGKAAYLAPIATVFGHPGRRFGMMAEALVLTISGTLLGVAWSMLGLYLSSMIFDTNRPAAYTIKGTFLAISLLFHGFLRSHTPRLWLLVLLLIIICVVSLTSTATAVSTLLVTQLLYPILTAGAISLVVNVFVFPEFSSSFLGITTIETLGETVGVLRDAGKYFIHMGERSAEGKERKEGDEAPKKPLRTLTSAEKPTEKPKADSDLSLLQKLGNAFRPSKSEPEIDAGASSDIVKLKSLTDSKAQLRAKLASCKAAQQECNFELAWAVLPPEDLKPISNTNMKLLVANTIALIGACESKYALLGDEDDKEAEETKKKRHLNTMADDANIDTEDEVSSRPVSRDEGENGASRGDKKERRRKKSRPKNKMKLEREMEDLELVKPRKEIEFGDTELLKYLVNQISKPLADLQEKIDRSVDVVTASLAYCYDVPKLPSGARAPTGIKLEEIDVRVDILTDALADFDRNSALALEGAASIHDPDLPQVDIMPRMETFLISSFLLNLRQNALHILEMLRHSRIIVEKRQSRHGRRRLYAPKINWRKWLISGGEQDVLALPESGRKDARTGKKETDAPDPASRGISKDSLLSEKDLESAVSKNSPLPTPKPSSKRMAQGQSAKQDKESFTHRFRNQLADSIEYLVGSEDVLYAIKLTVAVFLVAWPAFMHRWNSWFSLNRGLWAALQLVLIAEVAIGTSVVTFTARAFGTTIGCLWGYAAYEAGNGNRVIAVVILVIGIIPSTYVQLGSKYIKAGMVIIISMCIVTLATIDKTTPGTATEIFLQRLIAFLIGGVVALIIEVVLFPVKARDRLVESLAASVHQISEMEACLAYGIETEANIDPNSKAVSDRFDRAKGKAEGALAAAETFLPFCANEPRLKGSFAGLALIYAEILYVLHAIVDRMDNMLHLRREYGSGVLEELNAHVYPYRRNVAGSITLILFAIHEALTTKIALPQFLPSARLTHLRMVNRVREIVLLSKSSPSHLDLGPHDHENPRSEIEMAMVRRVVRQKFLSWNAASAGQIEVIEFLEELIDLTKLLVGANEFRSGLLTRPSYREYVDRIGRGEQVDVGEGFYEGVGDDFREREEQLEKEEQDELRDSVPEPRMEKDRDKEGKRAGLTKRRTNTLTRSRNETEEGKRPSDEDATKKKKQADEEELPRSLQRVRSRRVEEMQMVKSRSRTGDGGARKRGKEVEKSQ